MKHKTLRYTEEVIKPKPDRRVQGVNCPQMYQVLKKLDKHTTMQNEFKHTNGSMSLCKHVHDEGKTYIAPEIRKIGRK